ncbi:hypothetical protein ACLVWQ_19140 [Streptomyces sp. CWNU-52B]|uniref:hypothetical protein n=1 Tax=unclassified Streptomyces TaxID=2593676 RepID=UPI0039C4048F
MAGRRALRVLLLVGGLFVLGLLFGEQAHAADGAGQRQTSGSLASTTVPASLPGVIKPATDEVERAVRPVTEAVVPPVVEGVVRPVGDLVDQITAGVEDGINDGINDGIGGGTGEQPAPPQWLPTLPELPTLPDVPELPGLPESPGLLPAVPGQPLPADAGTEAPQGPGGAPDGHRTARKQSDDERAAVYGPRFANSAAEVAAGDLGVPQPRHPQDTEPVQAPVHQVPDGRPTGALGRCSAVDNGSPKHGDVPAVTLSERARPTLVPGATADVTAAGSRDRHRDIPAFPG